MYILCAYKKSFDTYPNVYIIGLYDTLEEVSKIQEEKCKKITKININGMN